jgi:hypothetical protein
MQEVPHSREILLALSEGFRRGMNEHFAMDMRDLPPYTSGHREGALDPVAH